jgi:hypothetical protein
MSPYGIICMLKKSNTLEITSKFLLEIPKGRDSVMDISMEETNITGN